MGEKHIDYLSFEQNKKHKSQRTPDPNKSFWGFPEGVYLKRLNEPARDVPQQIHLNGHHYCYDQLLSLSSYVTAAATY